MSMDTLEKLIAKINKSEEESNSNRLILILALVGGIVAVACIAYAVYRFLTPDYFEDYDDDFDDDEEEADKPVEA